MKKIFLILTLILLGISVSSVQAEEGHERIEHYEASKPENKSKALALLNKSVEEIAVTLNVGALDGAKFETIHQKSYAMEAAAEVLEASGDIEEQLMVEIIEAVEGVHHASEDHEEAETRAHLAELMDLLKQL